MLPSKIGRYEIVAELGRGAMGVVYRATDPAIGRTVALKTLRLDSSAISHEELVRRFQQEARAAGALNQRNIVTIYDAGESENTFYIAMEYLEGQTLAELVRQQRTLHPDTIAEIGAQICAGLDYAHRHGVVHRDIKPANIMITGDSTVKIMDFGIAKVEASLTLTGQVVGTPDYMSPEQVKGNRLDGRSDLFSVGVILYEMATGERPFVGQSMTTIMYKIVHESPVPPERLDSSVPEGLGGIIMRALAKAPEARFQSAQQMGEALRNYRGQPAFHDAATVGMTALNWQPPPTTSAAHPAAPPAGAESLNSSTTQRTGTKKTRRSAGIAAMVLLLAAGIAALVMRSGSPSKVSSSTNPSETSRGTATPSATQPDHPPEPPSLEDSEDSDNHIRVTADGTKVDIPDIAKTIPGMDVLDPNFGSKMVAKVMAGLGGHLIVNTNPPGAKVELDGKTMDRSTPLDLQKVSSGQHELVLTMPGFEGVRMKVPAVPGRAVPINVKLEPVQGPPGQESGGKQTGRLQVQTKPAGATLNLKGAVELVGLTSPSDLSLPPGEYRVTMLLANYIPLNLEVQVRAGKTTKVKESFKTMPR